MAAMAAEQVRHHSARVSTAMSVSRLMPERFHACVTEDVPLEWVAEAAPGPRWRTGVSPGKLEVEEWEVRPPSPNPVQPSHSVRTSPG